MAIIVQCNCGAEYRRTEEKFLVPHTGDAVCTVCGAALESWRESTPICSSEWSPRWGSSLRWVRIIAKDPPGRITSYSGNDGPRARSPDIELQDVEGGARCLLLRKEHCLRFGRPNLAVPT